MKKTHSLQTAKVSKLPTKKSDLLTDLCKMIEQAQQTVASTVNSTLTALN